MKRVDHFQVLILSHSDDDDDDDGDEFCQAEDSFYPVVMRVIRQILCERTLHAKER